MKNLVKTLAVVAFCVVSLLPQLAEARAGGGGSMGSRGTRTYSAPSHNAAPLERSYTPPPASAPNYPPAQSGSGFAPSSVVGHPFLTGIAGGFLGAGLAGMLFGHGGYGGGSYGMDGSPMGGAFGGLLQMLAWGAIGYFAYRWYRGRSGGGFGGLGLGPRTDAPFVTAPTANPAVSDASLSLSQEDLQSFKQLLINIQNAWSAADLNHLRQFVTPEMLGYFSETLSENTSRGEVNRITDVKVANIDVLETWSEYNLDYAT